MYIIAYGNPIDGFFHVGPFDTKEEAQAYTQAEIDRDWWIVNLLPPAKTSE